MILDALCPERQINIIIITLTVKCWLRFINVFIVRMKRIFLKLILKKYKYKSVEILRIVDFLKINLMV